MPPMRAINLRKELQSLFHSAAMPASVVSGSCFSMLPPGWLLAQGLEAVASNGSPGKKKPSETHPH